MTLDMKREDCFVPIIMGSVKDYEFAQKIGDMLCTFRIPHEYRVCSGEKHPRYLMHIVDDIDAQYREGLVIYETVAGRSNKLSGITAGLTENLVIACPPDTDKAAFQMDAWSTIRPPSDSPVLVVPGAGNAGLATVAILSYTIEDLREELRNYRYHVRKNIEQADDIIRVEGQKRAASQ